MELKDTIEDMISENYIKRLHAEYLQVKIRYKKLSMFIEKYDKGMLDFEPSCDIEILKTQLDAMSLYIKSLEQRMKIEDSSFLKICNILY